ncbi:MAG: WD40 repeat domain-containing protein [Epsilonproteobacteria bacterium]|nr:WD40 repeat domain-containing protein [Campylobacterota bacterium]
MRILLTMFFLVASLFAQKLVQPVYVYKTTKGLATDVDYAKNRLYIATDAGRVDIFDTKTKKELKHIDLTKIKDFMGDEIDSKIFTIDMHKDILLILSQDSGGYSRVHFYENKALKQVISQADKLNIIKAKFIDKNNILLALISNDIILYNVQSRKIIWSKQASMSKFSNFALNAKRSIVAVGDESGAVHLLDTKNGKKLQTLDGENVDNLFSVAFRGDIVLTGGQDRRAAVYNIKSGLSYHKISHFFVYGVGLSPSGKIGAYSCDIDNNVELFHTATQEKIATYKATKKVVNSIYFINEKEFFINSSAKSVGYYRVK